MSKVYNLVSSYVDDTKSDMPLIKKESNIRKKFYFPKNMKAMNILLPSDKYDLSCTHMYDDKQYERREYTKEQVNQLIDEFKENMMTAASELINKTGKLTAPEELDNCLFINLGTPK